MEIQVEYVEYDFQKVKEFWESCEAINEATEYPQNPTNLKFNGNERRKTLGK
jgi:hypothetical protein